MCGIAGLHRRTNRKIEKFGVLVDELLLEIEERGRDSTGFLAMLDTGRVQMHKAPVSASRFLGKRQLFSGDARTVLLHTRYATVGARTSVNAHPVVSGRCAAVHNGTISNHQEIFTGFGLKRKAQVDSEVIPAVVDFAGWDQAGQALSLLQGGAATAIVNAEHPGEVILARLRTYPLVYMVTRDLVIWASTRRAIERAWLMTYKRPTPPSAVWTKMDEYTLLRINGKLIEERIPMPKRPKPKNAPTAARPKAERKRGKRGRRGQMSLAGIPNPTVNETRYESGYFTSRYPAPAPHHEIEPWMDDAVTTLMRTEGYNRQEAEEAIYGVTVTSDDEADYYDLIHSDLNA